MKGIYKLIHKTKFIYHIKIYKVTYNKQGNRNDDVRNKSAYPSETIEYSTVEVRYCKREVRCGRRSYRPNFRDITPKQFVPIKYPKLSGRNAVPVIFAMCCLTGIL